MSTTKFNGEEYTLKTDSEGIITLTPKVPAITAESLRDYQHYINKHRTHWTIRCWPSKVYGKGDRWLVEQRNGGGFFNSDARTADEMAARLRCVGAVLQPES